MTMAHPPKLSGLDIQLWREVANAGSNGRVNVARKWIELGANVHLLSVQGSSLLSVLCSGSAFDAPMASMLVSHGARLDGGGGHPVPLFVAARVDNAAAIEWLLQAGANAQHKIKSGESALTVAARMGSARAGVLLLHCGADTSWIEKEALTALSHLRWDSRAAGEHDADIVFASGLWAAASREANRLANASLVEEPVLEALKYMPPERSVRVLEHYAPGAPVRIWQALGERLLAEQNWEALDHWMRQAPDQSCALVWEGIASAHQSKMPQGLQRLAQREARAIGVQIGVRPVDSASLRMAPLVAGKSRRRL